MKTSSNFLCGLPSSSKLHRPAVKRLNRASKDFASLRRNKAKLALEEARLIDRDMKIQRKEQQAVIQTKQSRFGGFLNKVKAVLNKKVW